MNNKIFIKIITIISFCAFMAINMTPNIPDIYLCIVPLFVGGVIIWKRTEELTTGGIKVQFLLLALILNIICAITFYSIWRPILRVQKIASMIGLSSSALMIICAFIGGLCAIPLSAFLIQRLFGRTTVPLFERINNLISSAKAYYFCVSLSIIAITFQIVFSFSRAIWYDESFSLAIIKHSYPDMIALTAADVHPPLYYIILKFCVDTLHLFLADVPAVYFAKLVSVIPFILLFLLSVTKVRKEWGNYVSGMWALASVAMPNLISYGVEIRMYSWSLLFVTAGLLYAYDIVVYRKKVSWVMFVACGLAAAYTHYFAGIAAGVSYLFLLVWSYLRDKKLLLPWFAATVATAIGYFPWLTVFFQQAQAVRADYWIPDITFDTIINYIVFMCGNMFIAAIVVIIIVYMARKVINNKCTVWKDVFTLTSILIPIGIMAVGVFASMIIRPVFINRYTVPGLACLWLGILITNACWERINLKAFISVIIIVICTLNICSFAISQIGSLTEANTTFEFFAAHKDAVYLQTGGGVLPHTICVCWKLCPDLHVISGRQRMSRFFYRYIIIWEVSIPTQN